ncbi:MAG: SDR family NAD(P)-dependent oxidoreductase [Calditrichaeota bacterium]|nr:SDR family NAD(P)-dependent oxidoreductase [Candidatus Cloacimonadota bacterium]MCA9788008.1 SDR family NAD(P)-dependent oxidoreductase [Candidatus Cloacimonadota bacterium]MCB1047181.1 SDR family NAD(P)-dependent oxidoreductase [Calditrichota bacterium]MCB9474383.1 SDR family NAD(P)-dependent oxidoreductase [Candidatus Delongbacteria bacterium]
MHSLNILVTGGTRGIGKDCVRQLAHAGHRVLFTARDETAGAQTVSDMAALGLECGFVLHEQRDLLRATSVIQETESRLGQLDVLVNNAGVLLDRDQALGEVSLDDFRSTLDVNLSGVLALCQAALPGMRARNFGRIVNVSSGYGQQAALTAGLGAYKLSKLALNGLTRILADECRGTNILINAVSPGWVRTDMGGPNANRSVEEGAASVVWAALLPDSGPSGGFFRDGMAIDF